MKKLVFIIVFAGLAAWSAFCAPGDVLYVGVKNAPLKAGTGFFQKTNATVYYGDAVVVVSEQKNWVQVRLQTNSSVRGWVSASSLTKKKIITGKTVSASADEIALAGKGFSPEAESVFKSENPEKRYDLVDAIEAIIIEDSALNEFITAGNLNGGAE
jgi:uncharacterized protein YgiM (DUF1202 family)